MPLRARIVRAVTIGLLVVVVAMVGYLAAVTIVERNQTARTTERFDPPVWAGQNFVVWCAGGFYARQASTIVLVISAHCGDPGDRLESGGGAFIGVIGPRAEILPCPTGPFCAPSDIQTLALAPERIPWGHLNTVDLGAGGYRTLEPGTRPLACGDIAIGDPFEFDGREHYRSGNVVDITTYANGLDTTFPCMIVGDRFVSAGDSGAAVLIRGIPAGIVSRRLGEQMGFTPLAEGLQNLELTLCTTPDCDLSPERAVQP